MPKSRPLADRFWEKVQRGEDDECWLWLAVKQKGYGAIWIPEKGLKDKAHRISYELTNGSIPEGMLIHHRCENRACVNPRHLEAMTSEAHTRLHRLKAPRKPVRTVCSNGHELTPENTRIRMKKGNPVPICRECSAVYAQQLRARHKILGLDPRRYHHGHPLT